MHGVSFLVCTVYVIFVSMVNFVFISRVKLFFLNVVLVYLLSWININNIIIKNLNTAAHLPSFYLLLKHENVDNSSRHGKLRKLSEWSLKN